MDVVGVGLQDGGLVLHNLKYDEVIMKFQQDWGPVTTVTFRTGKISIHLGIYLYVDGCVISLAVCIIN